MSNRLNKGWWPQFAALAAILLFTAAGCSSRNLGQIDETPDDREEMAGPGVFSEDDGQTKLKWSTDKDKSTTTAAATDTTAATTTAAATDTTAATTTDNAPLDEKAEFEQFKAWNALRTNGADSAEYQEFLQWLEYQKFKNSQ